jgi:hypothetical protein
MGARMGVLRTVDGDEVISARKGPAVVERARHNGHRHGEPTRCPVEIRFLFLHWLVHCVPDWSAVLPRRGRLVAGARARCVRTARLGTRGRVRIYVYATPVQYLHGYTSRIPTCYLYDS